jgi:hypothetical protein
MNDRFARGVLLSLRDDVRDILNLLDQGAYGDLEFFGGTRARSTKDDIDVPFGLPIEPQVNWLLACSFSPSSVGSVRAWHLDA